MTPTRKTNKRQNNHLITMIFVRHTQRSTPTHSQRDLMYGSPSNYEVSKRVEVNMNYYE